jgi:hypothetical protein
MSRRAEACKAQLGKYRPGEKDLGIAAGTTCQFAMLRLALPVVFFSGCRDGPFALAHCGLCYLSRNGVRGSWYASSQQREND